MRTVVSNSTVVVKLVSDDNCSQSLHDSAVETLLSRIEWVLQNIWGGKPARMEAGCGLVRGHVETIKKRLKNNPSRNIETNTLSRIAKGSGVSATWLATGDGFVDESGIAPLTAKLPGFESLELTAEQTRLAHAALAEGAIMHDVQSAVEAMRSAQKELTVISPGTFYDAIKLARDMRLGPMRALFRGDRNLTLVRDDIGGEPTNREFPTPGKSVEEMDANGAQRQKEREDADNAKDDKGKN